MSFQYVSSSDNSIGQQLTSNERNIDTARKDSTKSQRTDLRGISRCDYGVAAEYKPAEELTSKEDRQ